MSHNATFSNISELKDAFLGRACYIIASGPSTKSQNLSALNNEFVIGVNQSYLVTEQHGFHPSIMCLSDPFLFERIVELYGALSSKIIFARVSEQRVASKYQYSNLLGVVAWHSEVCISSETNCIAQNVFRGYFSHDLERGIYPAFNVVPELAIPVAIYAGAKEIYLLGCDCNNSGYAYSKELDFGLGQGITNGIASSPQEMWANMIIPAYQTIHNYAIERNVKIFNASPGGNLEVFPRVSLSSLSKQAFYL